MENKKNILKPSTINKNENFDLIAAKKYCDETLNKMIGMTTVKTAINNLLDRVYIQQIRESYNLKNFKSELNLIFSGNPGTGKTSVARIIGSALKYMGILSSGHTIEVTRKDLVAQHIGATALKTQEVINKAIGGVLFIDEAYSLDSSSKNSDFGSEAIETLMVAMENHRHDLVVIVAGYPAKIESFINSNPGLKSRFSKTIEFPDFSADEIVNMTFEMLGNYDYIINESDQDFFIDVINKKKTEGFFDEKNGRGVRLFIDSIIENQTKRLIKNNELSIIDIQTIKKIDFLNISSQ